MNRKWFIKLLSMGGVGSALSATSLATHSDVGIIKPRRLQKGDTIGLVSPGSRLHDLDRYDEIVEIIKGLGYRIKEGENARNQYGYFAGTDEERAADFNAMFADDTVDAILPFRGGWGCNRILSLIDYDLIAKNPKILVGFSDITSLLLAIYAKTGLITFHGPVGKSDWTDYTVDHFTEILSGQGEVKLEIPQNGFCKDCDDLSIITPGAVTGHLLGGNLTVLTAMAGSNYLPDWNESILFVEDIGEDVYRIDRMMTQLKLSGVLDQISGFIFGQCTECERANSYSLTLQQVLEDHLEPLGIPAFSGAMFGHLSKMLTLPVGLPAKMDAQSGTIELSEPGTVSD